ncbi:hypothetical protein LCGC14_1730860 [marine sediment metagenome]|uniref:Uncharacterized protein n=1 Tax=marine sediment metagenome TaxID=412755 RepID=A0A0F9K9A5_9ZZZZ
MSKTNYKDLEWLELRHKVGAALDIMEGVDYIGAGGGTISVSFKGRKFDVSVKDRGKTRQERSVSCG